MPPADRRQERLFEPNADMDDDDFRPRRPAAGHEIGQKLDTLSVDDLAERIALLKSEVARLEAAKAAKEAAKTAAGSIFRT